jgi:ribonuclease P protein component
MSPTKKAVPIKKEEKIANRKKIIQGEFTGIVLKESTIKSPKNVIVVSKKIDKKAVSRNKIKRRIRQILISLKPKIKPGIQMIILTKKNSTKATYSQLEGDLKKLITKVIKLYDNNEEIS